jgi:hypothetical protein
MRKNRFDPAVYAALPGRLTVPVSARQRTGPNSERLLYNTMDFH